MLPESLRRYAPQVRGTAATAARVVISQNGRKIREVNVAPGPFVIDDLYDSAYAGDLDVQVFEADGSVSSFSVPFASVPESMRPGLSRYSFTLGQARQYGDGDDLFADFTYQRGMSNALTANLGLRVADDYLAMLGGGVLATRFGAFGLNSTYSSARVEDGARKQGWRIGLDYSRTFQPTGTTLTLAGYRYSTEGYRELGDVLGSRDALRHGDTWDSGSYKQRNQFNLLVSQALGGYGNLYLSGSSSDFYDGKSRDTQLQFGYSNTWGQLSYNLAWSRQTTTYYQEQGDQDPGVELLRRDRRSGQRNDTLTLSVSMPLGSSSRAPTLQRHGYPALRRQPWRQPANRAERYAGRRAYLELRAVRQPRQRGRRHHLERHVAEAGGAGHRECRLCPRRSLPAIQWRHPWRAGRPPRRANPWPQRRRYLRPGRGQRVPAVPRYAAGRARASTATAMRWPPRCRPIATTRSHSIPLASIPTPNCWKPSARSRPTPVPACA